MLTDRQLLILKVIVDEFVDTAQPIGSRNIAKKDQVGFSPATIRNEMADLEELGFLQKLIHLRGGCRLKKDIVSMSII